MGKLIDTLIRYYRGESGEIVVTDATAAKSVEARLLDLASHDASTFPYLP